MDWRMKPGRSVLTLGVLVFVAFLGVCVLVLLRALGSFEATGQVFVVLSNRQTIKLSAVDVFVIDAEAVGNHVRQVEAATALCLSEAQMQLAVCKSNYSVMHPQESELRTARAKATEWWWGSGKPSRPETPARWLFVDDAAYQQAVRIYLQDLRNWSNSVSAWNSKVEQSRSEEKILTAQIDQIEALMTSNGTRWAALNREISRFSSPAVYTDKPWPTSESKCTTDADGRFSVKVPNRGSYCLAAAASRLINSTDSNKGTEYYVWVVPVAKHSKEPMLLNNANLLVKP